MLDVLQEQIDANEENRPPENVLLKTIRVIGEYLIDKTENTGGKNAGPFDSVLLNSLLHIRHFFPTVLPVLRIEQLFRSV